MLTIFEKYNDDNFINHHGFKRNIPPQQQQQSDLFFVRSGDKEMIGSNGKTQLKTLKVIISSVR